MHVVPSGTRHLDLYNGRLYKNPRPGPKQTTLIKGHPYNYNYKAIIITAKMLF